MKTMIKIFMIVIMITLQANNSDLISEIQNITIVNNKNINHTYAIYIRANKALENKIDVKLIKEIGRLMELSYKVDSNYYTLEAFTGVIQKDKKLFMKEMKKSLSKKTYIIFEDNIKTLLREIKNGNG